jgi:hypothetical protein
VKIRTALAGLGLALVAAAPGATAEETVVETERINFNIGCNQENGAPTCASTQYWLGTNKGNNSVGQNGAVTPLDWATHKSSGEYRTTAFTGDTTLAPSYLLKGGSVVKGQITLSGFLGGGEVGVDSGVFVRLSGSVPKARGTGLEIKELGTAEVTKTVSSRLDTVYRFSFTVPAELDGKPVKNLTADVGQRHVTVLQNGFMDGRGASFLDLPHVVPAS